MARKQTILVVEDDEDLRRLFRTALTLGGYEVEEAGDGLEALHKIDQAPPDLVVLDLMLPQISGFVVHQEIAAHVMTRQIPVVIITGSSADLGAVKAACVLRKPISPEELINTVQQCLVRGAPGMGS
jgi:two-component system, OmpR family, phosphate regulon response regulator PhoB